MNTTKVDIKALEEANGETKERLEKIQNTFMSCTLDFVNSYLDMLTHAKNKITMAYISADIVKMFLKGKNRLENLNGKITDAITDKNYNYAERLLDSMADNVENKALEFYCGTVCEAHDKYLSEILQEQSSESIIFQVKSSAEIAKDLINYTGISDKKREEEIKAKLDFYRKNII